MTQNSKIAVIAISALAAGGLAFFIYDSMKKKKAGLPSFGTSDTSGSSSYNPSTSIPEVSFPLKKGSKGEEVKALQRFLNSEEAAGLNVDGDFGPATEKAWLQNQACDVIANTNNDCWKNYKQHWPSGIIGQVDKEFYNANVSKYQN